VASYPKDQFPTEAVYRGDFTQSEIRLVTCGGAFDKLKHYLDNVIVFAHLQSTAETGPRRGSVGAAGRQTDLGEIPPG